MDGTPSTVNYLFSPTSNDYYDHHSFQPIQPLSNIPYYQSDAVECLYEHHKSDFQSPPPYIYHSTQHHQQGTYGYGPSIYDIQSNQPFVHDSNLILLQNPSRLTPVYELSPPPQTSGPSTGRIFKREIEDTTTTSSTSEKNHVYEWMKGT